LAHVESARVVSAAGPVADGADACSRIGEQSRGGRANLAESLDGHGRAGERNTEVRECRVGREEHAATGGVAAAERAAERDRLAGDNRWYRTLRVHRVRVEDPGHNLLVRADIRRGNVGVGAKDSDQAGRVPPRDAFQFAHRQRARIAEHAALGAAERKIDDGALPRHSRRERPHFVGRDAEVIANAAFSGATQRAVYHAIAGEHVDASVVHFDRNCDRHFAFRLAKDTVDAGVEIEGNGRAFVTREHRMHRVRLARECRRLGDVLRV
jgi:hypothetical protein